MQQPIDQIKWIDVNVLKANDYNPNHVFKKEMNLLHTSITRNGWLQPIIVNKDMTIIDGYHRVTLIKTSPDLQKQTKGLVPCIILQLNEVERKLLTIRINRAKGTHTAYKMSEVIHDLHHNGLSIESIAKEIGADKTEILLLLEDSIFTKNKYNEESLYNQAWTPK